MDDIKAETRRAGGKCPIPAMAKSGHSKKLVADALAAVADPTLSARAVSAALAKHGIEVGQNGIQRHRRGECACGRS